MATPDQSGQGKSRSKGKRSRSNIFISLYPESRLSLVSFFNELSRAQTSLAHSLVTSQ